jgi:PAS domain S-box-containing protein
MKFVSTEPDQPETESRIEMEKKSVRSFARAYILALTGIGVLSLLCLFLVQKSIDWIFLIIHIFILFLVSFFIFRPATIKIKNMIATLVKAEAQASKLAQKLYDTNISLEKSLKELKDINNAIENATIIARTDKYGIIEYVNDRFCEISKFSREELLGSRFGMMSGHYHSKAFFDNMWEAISSGKIWNNEIKNRAKDGTYFWLDATIVPVLDKNNTPVKYIALYTDVTQRFKQSIHEQKIRSVSIIEGQERERRKIARELHDGLGQMLTALKFTIEGLKLGPTKSEKNKQEDIRNLVQETIAEVRKISFNLMPSVLNDFGIPPALKHLTEMVSRSSGKKVVFEDHSGIGRLSKTVEINLYRIVQEALNNAIKYSEADQVKVTLENDENALTLKIEDNGKGFNKTRTLNGKPKSDHSGNGIINIQERTSLIDGQFNIITASGEGTKISIKVPLTNIIHENNKSSVS